MKARYRVGDKFNYVWTDRYNLKHLSERTVLDVLTTTNAEAEVVQIEFVTEHIYEGNLIRDCIAQSLII